MSIETRLTNNSMVRRVNRKKILSCINNYGKMPRVKICKKTGLSKPTVTRLIDGLIKEGFLVEKDYIESKKGRHPINIDINESAGYCFGINLSKNTLGAALVDLKMNIVEKRLLMINNIVDKDTLVNTVISVVEDIIKISKIDKNKILGIGVGAPGLVDYKSGVLKNFALGGKLCGIPLKDLLEKKFGFPVEIDNNCNTRMLGEHWYGFAVGYDNAMFVINSEGVGCGLVMDSKIYRKLNNIASGFGHISVNINGAQCSCGSKGCIETYCSTEAIEKKIKEKLELKYKKTNGEILPDIPARSYKKICSGIDEGNMEFAYILIEAACAMACGLVSMINLFRPQVIVLSGNMFDVSDFYFNMVQSEVSLRLGYSVEMPKIFRRKVKDALYEVGAATMILQKIL